MTGRGKTGARGFTLIEVMVVIAIIAAIAAIAIPNLQEARKASNEAAAIAAMRTIFTAQQAFQSQDLDRNDRYDYAGSLATLGSAGLLIDDLLATGERNGYRFRLHPFQLPESESNWQCVAEPLSPGRTGNRYFFVDQTGRILANTTGGSGGSPPTFVGVPVGQ